MPVMVNQCTYYRTAEACREAGISKNTFLRWVRAKQIADAAVRDRNGWRLITGAELERLKNEAGKISQGELK